MSQQKELQKELLEKYKEIVRKWMPDQGDLKDITIINLALTNEIDRLKKLNKNE